MAAVGGAGSAGDVDARWLGLVVLMSSESRLSEVGSVYLDGHVDGRDGRRGNRPVSHYTNQRRYVKYRHAEFKRLVITSGSISQTNTQRSTRCEQTMVLELRSDPDHFRTHRNNMASYWQCDDAKSWPLLVRLYNIDQVLRPHTWTKQRHNAAASKESGGN